jgi:hypothetical protein
MQLALRCFRLDKCPQRISEANKPITHSVSIDEESHVLHGAVVSHVQTAAMKGEEEQLWLPLSVLA